MNGIAWHYMHQFKANETLFWGEKLKKLSIEEEFPPWLALAKTHVGWAKAILEDVDEGVAELLEGIQEWNSSGLVVTTGFGYCMICHAYKSAERFEDVMKYADIAIEHFNNVEEKHYYSEALRYKAEMLAQSESKTEAEKFYQQSLEVANSQGAVTLAERTKDSMSKYLNKD